MRGQSHYTSARTGQFIAMDLNDPPIDFQALAASMGMPSTRIEKVGEIRLAVAAAIASGVPSLIEVMVDTE